MGRGRFFLQPFEASNTRAGVVEPTSRLGDRFEQLRDRAFGRRQTEPPGGDRVVAQLQLFAVGALLSLRFEQDPPFGDPFDLGTNPRLAACPLFFESRELGACSIELEGANAEHTLETEGESLHDALPSKVMVAAAAGTGADAACPSAPSAFGSAVNTSSRRATPSSREVTSPRGCVR